MIKEDNHIPTQTEIVMVGNSIQALDNLALTQEIGGVNGNTQWKFEENLD